MEYCSKYIWINFILVVVSVHTINAAHHYKLTLSPSEKEVIHFVNDSYIVTCNGYNQTRVRWMNPKQSVIEYAKGRVHVEEKPGGLIALVFESISLSDRGEWTCQSEEGNLKETFNMTINQPISFMDTPVIQSAQEDKDALIRCMVTGDPEPTVSWYFNGEILNMPHHKFTKISDGLIVKKVSKNDSGEYTCKAFQVSTTTSNVKEQTIRLNIQHKPIAPPRKASADIAFGYIKGTVNLTCEAEAEPAANFTWYRNNKRLSPKVHLMETEGHVSVLQIIVNDSKAFGDYKCNAQNNLGTLERTITLSEGSKPPAPNDVTLRGFNSDTFDLDVGAIRTSKTRHPMDINGYEFQIIPLHLFIANGKKWKHARVEQFGFEDGITYLINKLAENTTYNIRVAARNKAGLSDWTGPKQFTTGPKSPLGPSFAHRTCSINVVLSIILPILAIFISSIIVSNVSTSKTFINKNVCCDNRKT